MKSNSILSHINPFNYQLNSKTGSVAGVITTVALTGIAASALAILACTSHSPLGIFKGLSVLKLEGAVALGSGSLALGSLTVSWLAIKSCQKPAQSPMLPPEPATPNPEPDPEPVAPPPEPSKETSDSDSDSETVTPPEPATSKASDSDSEPTTSPEDLSTSYLDISVQGQNHGETSLKALDYCQEIAKRFDSNKPEKMVELQAEFEKNQTVLALRGLIETQSNLDNSKTENNKLFLKAKEMIEILDAKFESMILLQSYLLRQAEHRAYVEDPTLVEGEVQVLDDGNCLFHSIAYHLRLRKIDTDPHTLRTEALKWIKSNSTDAELQNHLFQTIPDFFMGEYDRAGRNNARTPEEQEADQDAIMMEKVMPLVQASTEENFEGIRPFIEEYCDTLETRTRVGESGTRYWEFASPAEAHALGRIHNLCFIIHKKTNGELDPIAPRVVAGAPESSQECHLIYTGAHFNPYFPTSTSLTDLD